MRAVSINKGTSLVSRNLHAGLVSIGLPVYNGARYLRSALDSLVAQDYPHFEIIISDNASEDETEAICREYAARDPRIRYSRADRNMGPVWNALQVYQAASGEYFMLAADDDLRHPRCLSVCVTALRQNPQAVMCCMRMRVINDEGQDISDTIPGRMVNPTGATPAVRIRRLAQSTQFAHIYAIFRRPIISETRFGKINVFGGDIVITAEICLRGEVIEVPEILFEYRFLNKTDEQRIAMQSQSGDRVLVSYLGLAADLLECVKLAPLKTSEKLKLICLFAVDLISNPNFRCGIRLEGLGGFQRALARGHNRSLTLVVGILSHTSLLYERAKNSLRLRVSMLKRALVRAAQSLRRSV